MREYPADLGPVGYALRVNRKAVGVIEANGQTIHSFTPEQVHRPFPGPSGLLFSRRLGDCLLDHWTGEWGGRCGFPYQFYRLVVLNRGHPSFR